MALDLLPDNHPGIDPQDVQSLATETSLRFSPDGSRFLRLLEPPPRTPAQLASQITRISHATFTAGMHNAFLVAAEYLAGGNEATPEKGIDKIAEIKAQSYPVSSPVLDPLLKPVFGENFQVQNHIEKVIVVVVLLSISPGIVHWVRSKWNSKRPEPVLTAASAETAD